MIRNAVTWSTLSYLPAVAVAALLISLLILRLYRPQLRNSHGFWRWTVPLFRLIAVAALFVALLRPSILRPAAPQDAGELVILLDDSPTMSVADASWTPAELVSLADALHELPPGITRPSTQDIQSQLSHLHPLIEEAARAASELEYARLAGRSVEAAGRHALQARAALLSACDTLAKRAPSLPPQLAPAAQWADARTILDTRGKEAWPDLRSRLAAAGKAIDAYQLSQDEKLYATDARVRQSCDALAHLSRRELSQRIAQQVLLPSLPPGAPVRIVTTHSTPDQPTDLAASLRSIIQQANRKTPLRAIILFTDARQGGDLSTLPQTLPLIAIRSTPATVRDVSLSSIVTPATAYVGDETLLHVELSSSGYSPGTQTPLNITWDTGSISRELPLDSTGRAEADIPVHFTHPGLHKLAIRLGPISGEATAANDSADRTIKVLSSRIAVAALASSESEELSSLHDLLSHAPGLTPAITPVEPLGPPAITPAQLLTQRIIILDDTSVESLSPEQLDSLREFVTHRAGSLILVAGRAHWPLDDNSEAVLSDLLPYPETSTPFWRSTTGRRPTPLPDTDPSLSDAPPVDRLLRFGDLKPSVHPLLIDPETSLPILLEMPAGTGRVLTLAADATLHQGRDSRRFWENLLRYAAGLSSTPDSPLPQPDPLADITPNEPLLHRLAESAGGHILPLSEASRLPAELQRRSPDRPKTVEYPLWDSPYLFLFVTACLTTEWALRKRLGLA